MMSWRVEAEGEEEQAAVVVVMVRRQDACPAHRGGNRVSRWRLSSTFISPAPVRQLLLASSATIDYSQVLSETLSTSSACEAKYEASGIADVLHHKTATPQLCLTDYIRLPCPVVPTIFIHHDGSSIKSRLQALSAFPTISSDT